ncbi:hypothetical protein AAKU55_001147 [Oxalobacteraceae bacterium GrIS 1.11]
MTSNNDFKAIAELELDPIKVKLMHQESGEGWSLEKVTAVEFEYRRFLYLMKVFPSEQTAPLFDVDTFWHYHILDTQKYAVDCEQVFGYFLHHFPYIGLRGEDDEAAHHRVGERMRELYEQTFGESYIRSAASEETAFSGAKTAFSGAKAEATAFSGAKVAFSGAKVNATAFSGAKVAFSGAKVAFSGAKVAFSGAKANDTVEAKVAFSGAKIGTVTADGKANFYFARPSLNGVR